MQNMELADLMRQITPHRSNGSGIQGGTIRGDPLYAQLACLQDCLKASEKGDHIRMARIVIQDLEEQPLESAIVHNG
jgi:hypothetical protein